MITSYTHVSKGDKTGPSFLVSYMSKGFDFANCMNVLIHYIEMQARMERHGLGRSFCNASLRFSVSVSEPSQVLAS